MKDYIDLSREVNEMRRDCLLMANYSGKQGFHFGGTLSLIEIVATLYLKVGNIFIEDKALRHRIILSKGHGMPAVYAALRQTGKLSSEDLKTFKGDETNLYAHPSMNGDLGIEFSSGSLGQGLSLGVGCSLALSNKRNVSSRVYVILGDGECNEGSVWEAAMAASKYNLNQLCVIIDKNGLQYDGETESVLPMASLADKWKSFGWDVIEINGHNVEECYQAFITKTEKPLAIIAHTVKGKGISFMENRSEWHFGQLSKELYHQAWEELNHD